MRRWSPKAGRIKTVKRLPRSVKSTVRLSWEMLWQRSFKGVLRMTIGTDGISSPARKEMKNMSSSDGYQNAMGTIMSFKAAITKPAQEKLVFLTAAIFFMN